MTVVHVEKDPENLRLTITSQLASSVAEVWRLWDDPRLLEQWWGPPGYPMTVTEHDLRVGGEVRYHMTGPDGRGPRGWWKVIDADPPKRLEFTNGVGDLEVADEMPPITIRVDIEPSTDAQARMTITSIFATHTDMQRYLDLGFAEGMTAALGQIDPLFTPEEGE